MLAMPAPTVSGSHTRSEANVRRTLIIAQSSNLEMDLIFQYDREARARMDREEIEQMALSLPFNNGTMANSTGGLHVWSRSPRARRATNEAQEIPKGNKRQRGQGHRDHDDVEMLKGEGLENTAVEGSGPETTKGPASDAKVLKEKITDKAKTNNEGY